jgi:hypothetical protein
MDNRIFSRLRRWVREGIVFILLALAVMWGVDQYRKPAIPASFSATPMQSIDGNLRFHGAQPGTAFADLCLGDLVQYLPFYHTVGR